MANFFFKVDAAPSGAGTQAQPFNQASFDAALAAGTFRTGGADSITFLEGNGNDDLVISFANASGTVFINQNAVTPRLVFDNAVVEGGLNVDLSSLPSAFSLGVQYGGVPTTNPIFVALGNTLQLTAAAANALDVKGSGTVAVSALQSTLTADLSALKAGTVTAAATLSSDVTFAGNLGSAALTVSGAGKFSLNTANIADATITATDGVTISDAGDLSDLNGATVTATGTAVVALTTLTDGGAGTPVDLSKITAPAGQFTAVLTGNETVGAASDLGSVIATVASGQTLTLTDTNASETEDASFIGAGIVSLVAADDAQNLTLQTTGANVLNLAAVGAGKYSVVATGSGTDTVVLPAALASISDVATGSGADSITSLDGIDTIRMGAGKDRLTFANGADREKYVEGGGGDDLVITTTIADDFVLYYSDSDGNDTVASGAGADTIKSGAGNDQITANEGNNVIRAGSGRDLITSLAGNDNIVSGGGNDTVNSGGGNDFVSMAAGDDRVRFTVASLTAADTIDGGEGSDLLVPLDNGAIGDAVFANITNFNTLSVANGVQLNATLGAVFSATGISSVVGSTLVDTIDASSLTSNAHYTLGNSADILTLGTGQDTVLAGLGDDNVSFISARLTATDSLDGAGGTDILTLAAAGQILVDSQLAQVSDFETLTTNNGTNSLTLGANATNSGISQVNGGTGADTINAGAMASAVTFSPGTGNDIVTGGTVNDTIDGDAGADVLTGGTGNDDFVYPALADSPATVAANTTVSFDTITDFTTATDRLDFTTLGDALAGGNATGVTVTTLTTGNASLNDTTIATFAELKVAVDAVGLTASAAGAAGGNTGLQAYVIDLTGNTGALGTGKYLVANNTDTALTVADAMIALTGTSTNPAGTDFIV